MSAQKLTESKKRQVCEVYSRVVGYLRPVAQWNEGKQEEYSERKEYNQQLQEKSFVHVACS